MTDKTAQRAIQRCMNKPGEAAKLLLEVQERLEAEGFRVPDDVTVTDEFELERKVRHFILGKDKP